MLFRFRSDAIIRSLALPLVLFGSLLAHAQTAAALGDAQGDPIKLFERGQDAHARRDYQLALKLYEEAIKLQPEFPEAEYQRAMALEALQRNPEAEQALRRVLELRPDWELPHQALGLLLLYTKRFAEAEHLFSRALELEVQPAQSLLLLLASTLPRAADTPRESLMVVLRLFQRMTASETAKSDLWAARGQVEAALGERIAATSSFEHALNLDPQNFRALIARAEIYASAGDYERAVAQAKAAQRISAVDADIALRAIHIYLQAGSKEEAQRAWDALDEKTKLLPEAIALHDSMLTCEDTPENRAALEQALAATPRDASLLACLGAAYRLADPARSLEYYRRAADIEPNNLELAVGYTAALVQARRFEEAVIIARRVLKFAPDKYEAHANLATALYELKRYAEALSEFRWLAEAKPELPATYFFIATAYDYLAEYPAALTAYEAFLARADAQVNKLEIEKVNLRLPSLRNQIKRGEGAKKKGSK